MGNMNHKGSEEKGKSQVNQRRRAESMPELGRSRGHGLTSMINFQSLKNKIKNRELSLSFDVIQELGKGGQADVFETRLSTLTNELIESGFNSDETFALKRIYKNSSINRAESLMLGQQIIMRGECPFIIEGVFTCEDENYIYQLMKNAKGGDMSTFLGSKDIKCSSFKKLGEQGIKFIAAGIILGLEHLHANNIIYCDLKLENVLIDEDGYPRLTDFEMCRHGGQVDSEGYRGTINYIAPDLFANDLVDKAMDIWALGVCIYILINGENPYEGEDVEKSDFIENCQKNDNSYKSISKKASKELKNLINSLLRVDPKQRLGYANFSEIKNHAFFKGFDWEKYNKKELVSPLESIVEQSIKEKLKINPQVQIEKGKYRKTSIDRETTCDDLPNHQDVEF